MSVYTEISKRLNFERREVKLPTLAEAEELVTKATDGDRAAFERLFEFYRFAESAMDEPGQQIQSVIFTAFHRISPMYREMS